MAIPTWIINNLNDIKQLEGVRVYVESGRLDDPIPPQDTVVSDCVLPFTMPQLPSSHGVYINPSDGQIDPFIINQGEDVVFYNDRLSDVEIFWTDHGHNIELQIPSGGVSSFTFENDGIYPFFGRDISNRRHQQNFDFNGYVVVLPTTEDEPKPGKQGKAKGKAKGGGQKSKS